MINYFVHANTVVFPTVSPTPNPDFHKQYVIPIADTFELTSVPSSTDSPTRFLLNHRPESGESHSQSHQHTNHHNHQPPARSSSSSHFLTPPLAIARKLAAAAAAVATGDEGASSPSHNNVALIKIGEASALPVMLCGILQNKELFYQQALQHQREQQYLADLQAASPDLYSA